MRISMHGKENEGFATQKLNRVPKKHRFFAFKQGEITNIFSSFFLIGFS